MYFQWIFHMSVLPLYTCRCPITTLNAFCATSPLISLFCWQMWHFIAPLCCFNGQNQVSPPLPAWVVRSLLLFQYSNSSGRCVCSVCFIPYMHPYRKREYPPNRKWLSIDWRCTSFELILFYFSQDVYLLLLCLPLPPSIPPPFLYGDTPACI